MTNSCERMKFTGSSSSSSTNTTTTSTTEQSQVAPPDINPDDHLLTILVDDGGSCPENCDQFHTLLPDWIKFQYKTFRYEDIRHVKDPETEQVTFNSLTGVTGHILIVARWHPIRLAEQAAYHRKAFQASVGLLLMADEKHTIQDTFRTQPELYQNFDYFLRNYWFPPEQIGSAPLRALGNLTCGEDLAPSLPLTDTAEAEAGPRWGLHWVFLHPHTATPLLQRSPTSLWPTHRRQTNCSFIGWEGTTNTSKKDRTMVWDLSQDPRHADLNCQVQLFTKFNTGGDTPNKFHYVNQVLGDSKIGFNPRGVHPECHRLPEMMSMGTVPAMKQESYMQYTYKPIPSIMADTWDAVFDKIRDYLQDDIIDNNEEQDELTRLSQQVPLWWSDLQNCMRGDMNTILTGVFREYSSAVL